MINLRNTIATGLVLALAGTGASCARLSTVRELQEKVEQCELDITSLRIAEYQTFLKTNPSEKEVRKFLNERRYFTPYANFSDKSFEEVIQGALTYLKEHPQ